MADKRSVKLTSEAARQSAIHLIERAPAGYVATVGEETRSDAQNRLMWPVIQDIKAQVPDMARFTRDQIKLRFLNALSNEMQFLPELEGGGQFVVGQRSSTLTKGDFSMLVELMFQYAAQHEVKLSRRSEQTRDEVLAQRGCIGDE